MDSNFDRQLEQWYPKEPKVMGTCSICDCELFEGDEVTQYENELYCDRNCLKVQLIGEVVYNKIKLERNWNE